MSYYLFNIHTTENKVEEREYKQITSFDPAIKNLALRIERRYKDFVQTGIFELIDIKGDSFNDSMVNLTLVLNRFFDFINDSDYIFIEKQMGPNHESSKVYSYIIGFLLGRIPNNERQTKLYEISAKLKNKVLNPPKGTKYAQLKKLSIDYSLDLLTDRNDEYALNILKQKKKKDDLCDTVCQIEAMVSLLKI